MCPIGATAAAAPMITGNPPGAMYSADLKVGNATGTVVLSSADMGVKIDVKLTLPQVGAPFMYHIHAKVVPTVRWQKYRFLLEGAMLTQMNF